MAINSVSGMSNVAFKANAMDKVSPELLSNPGAYSQPSIYPEQQEAPAKRGSLLGGLVKLVAGAVIIAGVAVAARKFIPTLGKAKISGEGKLAEGAGFGEKVKHSFAKYTDAIYDGTIGKLKNLFKSKEKVAEGAEGTKTEGAPKTTETPPTQNEGGDGQKVNAQA